MTRLSVALAAAGFTAALVARAAFTLAAELPPDTSYPMAAVSCPLAAAVTVTPREAVSRREQASRNGWLALTYIDDALVELQVGRRPDAMDLMAHARHLIGANGQCIRQADDQTASADRAALGLSRAEMALKANHPAAATHDLTDVALDLHDWVSALDARLFSPQATATYEAV
jgi:hypothetical protein